MVSNGDTVGLISGGKDSLLALHVAQYMGYNPIVLGHIRPKDMTNEEDSYMFQTVGSHFIESIAECLDLPLVIRHLQGSPYLKDSIDYKKTDGDEVEDLYDLLRDIKLMYPSVKFVTTGAIFSDYQRCRVEDICRRLNLISLAFLWKIQQSIILKLLQLDPTFHAVVIKTASMGLTSDDLGKSVTQLTPKFLALEQQFGFHACGEGGEYETITLDCPLYKKYIQTPNWIRKTHSDNVICPVSYLYPELPLVVVSKESVETSQVSHSSATQELHKPKLFRLLKDRFSTCTFYMMDLLGTDQVDMLIQQALETPQQYGFKFLHHSELRVENLKFHLESQSVLSVCQVQETPLISYGQPYRFFRMSNDIKESFLMNISPRIRVQSHSASISLSFWRSCLSTCEPYDESWSLQGRVVVTNWITSRLPHSTCFPMTPSWNELFVALRSLRHLLRDHSSDLHSVEFLDLWFHDDFPHFTLEDMSRILTFVWQLQHVQGDISKQDPDAKRKEIDTLLWTGEPWNFSDFPKPFNNLTTPLHLDVREQSFSPSFRVYRTPHMLLGCHVAIRAIARMRDS